MNAVGRDRVCLLQGMMSTVKVEKVAGVVRQLPGAGQEKGGILSMRSTRAVRRRCARAVAAVVAVQGWASVLAGGRWWGEEKDRQVAAAQHGSATVALLPAHACSSAAGGGRGSAAGAARRRGGARWAW